MKTKLKNIIQQLLRSPKEFPVEAAMGLAFFLIAAWHTCHAEWDETLARMVSGVNQDILPLFVPLLVLTFWLGKVNRWAYVASGFLFLPLMALNLKPFLMTYGFFFTYVLAAILLVVGVRRMDNRSFAAHALHVVTQLFFGLVISGLITAALLAIFGSFFYIFGIDEPKNFYTYLWQFIWFFIAPQVCCTLISHGEYELKEPAKVLKIILNFILSPAIIIYTVILYAYFIKIALAWDLPKGGVAWMVMAFVTAALAGKLMQYVLGQRYYDWYYRYFTWIAIPPLIMYWIGSVYRVRLYSFTESRFYLMVAGVLMTLFVLMLLWKRSRRFQLMALIFGAAIIVFTYIPGISAKSIGLSCQKQRLTQLISEMKLTDPKTGKLNDEIEDMRSIQQDSLMCEQYKDVTSVIDYVRKEIGTDEFKKQYGEWSYSEYSFNYNSDDSVKASYSVNTNDNWHIRRKPVELGEYTIVLPQKAYQCNFNDQIVTITQGENNVVLRYPIQEVIRQDTMLLHHPEQLLTYRNDSLMLVLEGICFEDTVVTDVRYYGLQLFKKQVK
ncbi:MAG: DUF4153 domain-containing protein [Prevotella sp.]|nr:DUF4153 domain-containing protein [Prevotella sp.]